MTPQERKLVDELFERLRSLENAPRDPDAIDAINQGLDKAPNALYPLVQSVLVQDEALKRADARIRELEAELGIDQPQAQPQGGFLDNMRDALLGKPEQRGGSVPSVRAGANPNASGNASGNAWGPAYNQGAPIQPQQSGSLSNTASRSMASRCSSNPAVARSSAPRRRPLPAWSAARC